MSCVLGVDSGEKSEDALSRRSGQHRPYESLAEDITLFVHQDKEERLVLDDRSTETRAKLITVLVILRDAVKVVEPLTGVERGVAVRPKRAAPELVRPRACHHLHLPGTASDLGIHRSCDDAHFFDQNTLYRNFEYKPMPLYLDTQLQQ